MTVTLSGPACSLGRLVPVEQVAGGLAGRLREHGFGTCSVADRPPSELAADAIEKLLRDNEIAATDVDAVVYGTCSHRGERVPQDQAVRAALARAGLDGVRCHGVWLGESGNLSSAFRLARALLREQRNVLVVLADAVPDGPGEYRAMPNAVTVNGDGAAACLLSTVRTGQYTVEGIGTHANPAMATEGRGSGLREYLEFMAGVRGALAALPGGHDGYDWLVTNNYCTTNVNDFADLAGVDRARTFRDTVARHGHVFAADGLINLAELTARVAPGERVLVLCTGPFSWGAIGLRRNDD